MTKQIMVVDDDAAMLTLISLMLERAGYTVFTADSGIEALETLQYTTPDLILLDIMMPGMDGIELCKRIRTQSKTSRTPVLFLSAQGDMRVIKRGILAGATGYLSKPVTRRALISQIESTLGLSEMAAAM